MANFATLKAAIAAAIKQNGNNEITGNLLQQQLLAMVNSLGAGYQFAGIATPGINPGTPDQNVFYIAVEKGTYVNFSNIIITQLSVLYYNGEWRAAALNVFFNDDSFIFHRTLNSDENAFSTSLPIGIYAVTPTTIGVPDDYGAEYGWLIVFHDSLRVIFNNSGVFWFKTSAAGWNNQTKVATSINGTSDTLPVSQKAVKTAVDGLQNGEKNIASILMPVSGTEIQPDETMVGYILTTSTGKPYAIPSVPEYELKKYTVTPGDVIKIIANANYENYFYSILDLNGNFVDGKQTQAGANYGNFDGTIVIPWNGATLYVAYNTTVENGFAFSQLQFGVPENTLFGKKWACVGDSLTEVNARTTKHYFDYVAAETGVIPLNYGVSGTGYARRRDENIAFYQRISGIDVNCDIVTIFGSFNDLGAISDVFPLGDVDDSGIISIAGCINQTLDNLFAIKPIVRLGIVAPTPWDGTQPGTWATSDNYVALLKNICDHRSIPFLDLYHHSNLRPWDATFRQLAYSKDGGSGTHPDETGHSLIAPMFREFIKKLI